MKLRLITKPTLNDNMCKSLISDNMNNAIEMNNFNINSKISIIEREISEIEEKLNNISTDADLQDIYNNTLTGAMSLDTVKGYSIDADGNKIIDISYINSNRWNVMLNNTEYLTFNIATTPVQYNPSGNILYTKLDNNLYMLNSNGIETQIGNGGDSNTEVWEFLTSTDILDVNNGQFNFNNTIQNSTTEIRINIIDDSGSNRNVLLSSIASGSDIYIKNTTETTEKLFKVTGTPVLDVLNYKIPVSFTNSIGADFTDTELLNITFINRSNIFNQSLNTTDSPTFNGLDLTADLDMNLNNIINLNNINGIDPDQITINETDIATLETKTQNQTATSSGTTFTDLIINGKPITTNTDYTDPTTLVTKNYVDLVSTYGTTIQFGGNASSVDDDGKYFELYGKPTANLSTSNINTVFVSPLNCNIYSISWIKENNNSSTFEIIKNESALGLYTFTLSGLTGVIPLSISISQGDRIELIYKNTTLFPGNLRTWIQTITKPTDIVIPSVSNSIIKADPPGDDWTVFNSYMYLDNSRLTIKTSNPINIVL